MEPFDTNVRPGTWYESTSCRLCNSSDLVTVLELKPTPPANEFVKSYDPEQESIPLYLARCNKCGHVQLPIVVDPSRLFSKYVYVSGTSPAFVEHFRQYAEQRLEQLSPGDLVVEIGSNDGTLLRFFQDAGMRVVGVDPAEEIAKRACAAGILTLPVFFDGEVARMIKEAQRGRAQLVVANNVFAHADDLRSIALAVKDLLAPDGHFVFEVQYLLDLVQKNLFDMIYHEHLSYHSVAPLTFFFDELGMTLIDVQRVPTHGGSIRCTVAPTRNASQNASVGALMRVEFAVLQNHDQAPFEKMSNAINRACVQLHTKLASMPGATIAGYGAPAKLTTLCYAFGITRKEISYVVDDSKWKHGLYTPGLRIPVYVGPPRNTTGPNGDVVIWPDAFIVFAWNFSGPIAKKLREQGFTGKIIVPLPEYKEV